MSNIVVVVPDYIKQVQLSKSRRAKYYKEGDRIPKKYSNTENYNFVKDCLTEIATGQRVVRNVRTAGKERLKKVQGQDIWRGINFNLRSKIAKELKKYFYEYFRGIPRVNKYPIGIRIDFYDNVEEGEDIDNMIYFYRKTIHDALSGNVDFKKVTFTKNNVEVTEMVPDHQNYPPIIIDDSKKYVQSIPTRFYPIGKDEKPKMEIELFEL